MESLETWELLFINDSYDEEGIETGNYELTRVGGKKRLPLTSDNILVKNNEVIGFVLGKKHYPD